MGGGTSYFVTDVTYLCKMFVKSTTGTCIIKLFTAVINSVMLKASAFLKANKSY